MRTQRIIKRIDGLSINFLRVGAGEGRCRSLGGAGSRHSHLSHVTLQMFFDIVPLVRDGEEGKEAEGQGQSSGPSDTSDFWDASDGPDRSVLPRTARRKERL